MFKGDKVKKGQQLTEGPVDPPRFSTSCGPKELQDHLVNEVQEVYRLQGVTINDKHIEIIARQMMRKVRITETGDTSFLWGEQIEKLTFEGERGDRKDGRSTRRGPAGAAWHHEGLAGHRQLPECGIVPGHHTGAYRCGHAGKVDPLKGFKENVIMGHIVRLARVQTCIAALKLKPLVEEVAAPEVEEEEAGRADIRQPASRVTAARQFRTIKCSKNGLHQNAF